MNGEERSRGGERVTVTSKAVARGSPIHRHMGFDEGGFFVSSDMVTPQIVRGMGFSTREKSR